MEGGGREEEEEDIVGEGWSYKEEEEEEERKKERKEEKKRLTCTWTLVLPKAPSERRERERLRDGRGGLKGKKREGRKEGKRTCLRHVGRGHVDMLTLSSSGP